MSYKTFVDYNSDNIVKIIEGWNDLVSISKEEMSMINNAIKNASLIYTYAGKDRKRTVWEKTVSKKWFNWATYEIVDDDGMHDILNNIDEENWDYLEV